MTTQTQSKFTSTLSAAQLTQIIVDVTAAEKITKAGLSTLSRELLNHVYESGDVSLVNTLLGKGDDGKFRLTPINWRIAVQYFNEFIAFTSNYEKDVKEYATKGTGKREPLVFNKKSKKKFIEKEPKVLEWLAVSTNDIWCWSENVEMEVSAPDYLKSISNDIAKALDEEKGNMAINTILSAIVDNTDISLSDLGAFLENPTTVEEALAAEKSDTE